MSDKPKMVCAIPMDAFAAAAYDKEQLQEIADWMEATDSGMSNEEAWAWARQRSAARRTRH